MDTTRTTTSTSRKLLIPLATMAAAAAVTVGSGATWNSTTESDVSVTGGDLLHTNNRNTVTLQIADLKPGDTMTGTLTITNTGTVNSYLRVTEDLSANGFGEDELAVGETDLKLTIDASGMDDPLYEGDFGDWVDDTSRFVLDGATANELELVTGTGSVTLTFTVELIGTADNDSQEATASADYDFVTVPADGETGLSGAWDTLTGSDESTDGTP